MEHVTEDLFRARIVPLLTDARALPKRALDRHLLLISALAGLSLTESYSEGAINAHLERWLRGVGSHLPLDHVTLRRSDRQGCVRVPVGVQPMVMRNGN